MKKNTLRNGFLGSKCGTRCSFKGFVMFVVMMLMTANSAMAEVIDGLRYMLDSETKTATLMQKTTGFYFGNIIVPEKVKDNDGVVYVVTALGKHCFDSCNGLTSITIPSSVTYLGECCFSGCSKLKSIIIPPSVTFMGYSCFSRCSSLKTITIPSSVTSLDFECFENCSDLESIVIPSSVSFLGMNCFKDCSSLKTITIPTSVTSLPYGCFEGCSSLSSITIPSSVTSFEVNCFKDCSSLKSITIPSSVISLGKNCFYYCQGLTSIVIPSSVTSLGEDFLLGCFDLETIYFKGKLPSAKNYSNLGILYNSFMKVPVDYLQDYKEAFGSSCEYISAWNPSESGDDTKPVTPCAAPSISYESGKLMFACETTGAKYHYTITDTDIKSDALSENGEVSLSATYHISVYATADGYSASDKAEATLYWINANLENGTNINQVRTRGVVASAHDGIISLSGLDDGEVVKFFAADGKYLGSTVAANGAASYAVSESLVIAKVGKDSIKIAMK